MTTILTSMFSGEVDVKPRRAALYTSADFETITSANFILNEVQAGEPLSQGDFVFASYDDGDSNEIFTVDIDDGVYTLFPFEAASALTVANNAITLAKLATGITPAYVVKAGGNIPYAGGSTSTTIPVASAVNGDIASVQITTATAAIVAQVAILDGVGIAVTFSANPGSIVLSYLLFKEAA